MSTLIAVVILIVIGVSGALFWPTILNLAAVPGAIIGLPSGRLVDTRYFIGMLLATAVQSYVYLAFVGLVITGTEYYIHQAALSPMFVWPASFIACALPIYVGTPTSMRSGNPLKIMAAGNTAILAAIGFFLFAFFPKLFALGWPWISATTQMTRTQVDLIVVAVWIVCVIVCFLKWKTWTAIFGIIGLILGNIPTGGTYLHYLVLGPATTVGLLVVAIRLAKPVSWWAKWFYWGPMDSNRQLLRPSAKLARALARFPEETVDFEKPDTA